MSGNAADAWSCVADWCRSGARPVGVRRDYLLVREANVIVTCRHGAGMSGGSRVCARRTRGTLRRLRVSRRRTGVTKRMVSVMLPRSIISLRPLHVRTSPSWRSEGMIEFAMSQTDWPTTHHSAKLPSACRHTGFRQRCPSRPARTTYSSLISMPRPGPCGMATWPSLYANTEGSTR